MARYFGVKVDEFSIGFGKEIYGWYDKKGTRWKVSLLPLGGFVKMHGDESEASTPDQDKLKKMSKAEREQSFYFKPLWQKTLIVAAGPGINFIFAALIFASIFVVYGKPVREIEPIVAEVVDDSAAAAIGMQVGDKIVELDGKEITYFSDLQEIIRISPYEEMAIKILRDGKVLSETITPQFHEQEDSMGNKVRIGLIGIRAKTNGDVEVKFLNMGVVEAVSEGVSQVYKHSVTMLKGLEQIIVGIRSTKELGGPVKIMEYSGQSTNQISEGLSCLFGGAPEGTDCSEKLRNGLLISLEFMAMLSTVLGLVNLFPIPMLDGGHIMFYTIEAIMRRPVKERVQEWAFRSGFAFLAFLMLYVTYNDILSFVDRHIL